MRFPAAYWVSNSFALAERAAFFAVVPFAVIYFHEVLGMSPVLSTLLNGSVFWGLIYFLPIFTGIVSLKFGLKRILIISFFLLFLGYFLMGNVQRLWPGIIGSRSGPLPDYAIPVLLVIMLLGTGKSLVNTGIAGSIRYSSGERSFLGLGIFYLVLNIGAIGGRGISYVLRTQGLKLFPLKNGSYFIDIKPEISNIFSFTAAILSLIGLFLVAFIYREPEIPAENPREMDTPEPVTWLQALSGIGKVMRDTRFLLFFCLAGVTWMLLAQIFNLFPLFLRYVDPRAPVEIYTLVIPAMVLTFQILMTKLTRKARANTIILSSITMITLGMLINILPLIWFPDLTNKVPLWGLVIPIGGIFMMASLALLAIGEMILTPAMIDYISEIAPRGKEKYFQQYANLPVFLGMLVGAPLGGALFELGIDKPLKSGTAGHPALIWASLGGVGLIAWLGFFISNRLMARKKRLTDCPD